MSKIVCVAQTVEELKFIISQAQKNLIVIPIEIKVHLYCIENKIEYLNPIKYINNNFYKYALSESQKLIKTLKFQNLNHHSNQIEVNAILRYRLYSILFLKELITKIDKKIKIEKIILSGWNNYYGQYSSKNYFLSNLIEELFGKKKEVIFLTNKKFTQIPKQENNDFEIIGLKKKPNKKFILLSNLGYNFFRIVKNLKVKNTYFITELDKNINIFKRIVYKALKVNFFEFKKINQTEKKYRSIKIKFNYKDKVIYKLLNERLDQEKNNILQSFYKTQAIDKIFNQFNILLVFSNMSRGVWGYFLEAASKRKINSVCIPHGTLPEHFNQYDRIYKNIIAEAVLSEKSGFFAVQSKIAKKFFDKSYKKLNVKKILSGNLIFAENLKANRSTINNKILYAVTLRNFQNLQFLGVEMFYEFISNLSFLDNFSKKNNIEIIVKLHPSIKDSIIELERIFPKLKFSNKKIDKILKYVDFTISFSSTSIEDSIYSYKPVILLDQWKRYQHCKCEKNLSKKNEAIYYLTKKEDMTKCMRTIYKSDNIKFENYIYPGTTKENIVKLRDLIEDLSS